VKRFLGSIRIAGLDDTADNARRLVLALPLLALVLVVLLVSAKLWGPGIVNTRGGGDSPFLLQRLHQMLSSLEAGVFPVRWMPDAAYGLGYPFFNHYSALPFYVASLFARLGLDLLTALKLTQTLGFLIAALAMYGWVLRLWRNQAAAWLAAIAYTVAPFHLVNVYVRGDSLSEFFAFCFYPLILWASVRLVQYASRRARTWIYDVVLLALAYAGLVLSHNISAFIFTPFVLLFWVLLIWDRRGVWDRGSPSRWSSVRWLFRPLTLVTVSLLLGMALAAWAWLPALLELDYVQAGNLTGDYFDYAKHFRSTNLVQARPLFDYSIQVSLGGRSPFSMSGPQALGAIAGLFVLLGGALMRGHMLGDNSKPSGGGEERVGGKASFVFVIVGLLLSTIMIMPVSRLLWEHVPFLAQVQFPWRFLSIQALFTALGAAALVLFLKGRWAWVASVIVALLLALSTLMSLHPERLLIGPDDVTTMRLQEYELFTGNIGTTVRYEWLPVAAVPRPFTADAVIEPDASASPIALTGDLVSATQTLRHPTAQEWDASIGEGGATLAFPTLYWPGWSAAVDGVAVGTRAVEGSGYVAVDLPGGTHSIRLALGRTPLRRAAEALSLTAGILILAVVLFRIGAGLRGTRPVPRGTQISLGFLLACLMLLVGLLLFVAQSSPPPSRLDDLTMDFAAMPYLHHNPEGVTYARADDGAGTAVARLVSYTLSADQILPGEVLTATLNWDDRVPLTDDVQVVLRLVSPAEHFLENGISSYTWAEHDVPLASTNVHRLTLPENIPRGVYLLQLSLWSSLGELTARTPAGRGRGELYLRPVRVPSGAAVSSDADVLALLGPDIRLHAARLEPGPRSAEMMVFLEWSTVRRIASNYGISVRLLDGDGERRVAKDTQPGYGFSPTSLWRPEERVADRYALPIPGDVPPGDDYRVVVILYQVASGTEVGRAVLGPFALPIAAPIVFEAQPRQYALPTLSFPLDARFYDPTDGAEGDHIRLAGYDLVTQDDALELHLWWVAERRPSLDYTVFVHLFDPEAPGVIVAQTDTQPRGGAYPTRLWLPGEVVDDTIRLGLHDVPPGTYRLAVGLYNGVTGDRLLVNQTDALPLADGRLVLPTEVEVGEE
jgi:hypothetical protein